MLIITETQSTDREYGIYTPEEVAQLERIYNTPLDDPNLDINGFMRDVLGYIDIQLDPEDLQRECRDSYEEKKVLATVDLLSDNENALTDILLHGNQQGHKSTNAFLEASNSTMLSPSVQNVNSPFSPKQQIIDFADLLGIDKIKFYISDGKATGKLESVTEHCTRYMKTVDEWLPEISEANNAGATVYLRRNGGFTVKADNYWNSLIIEYDNTPLENQLDIVKEVCIGNGLPLPSTCVYTGNKSYHFYWVFDKPVEKRISIKLQKALLRLFPGSDENFLKSNQPSRLPGFKHRRTGKYSELIYSESTFKRYSAEELGLKIDDLKADFERNASCIEIKNLSKLREEVDKERSNGKHYHFSNFEKQIATAKNRIKRATEGTVFNALKTSALQLGNQLVHGLEVDFAYRILLNEASSKPKYNRVKDSQIIIGCLIEGFRSDLNKIAVFKDYAENPIYGFTPDKVVNSQFIPECVLGDLRIHKKIAIKSPIGTGKTTFIKKAIKFIEKIAEEQGKYPSDLRILINSHRITLCDMFYYGFGELGFQIYSDSNFKRDLTIIDRMVITPDSLWRLIGNRGDGQSVPIYDVVIFDEVDQLLDHAVIGQTDVRKHRTDCISVLASLIVNSEYLIATSATASNGEIEFFNKFLSLKSEKIFAIENTIKPFLKNFVVVSSEQELFYNICLAINSGEKTAIACNTKQRVKDVERKLKRKYPDKLIKAIHGDNSKTEAGYIRQLTSDEIHNIKPDILIYSSALGTGIDISSDYFDSVHCYFTLANCLASTDLLQMSGRVRYPKTNQVFTYVEKGLLPLGDTLEDIENSYLKRISADTLTRINPSTGKFEYINKDVTEGQIKYAAYTISRKNLGTRNLHQSFWELVKANGHTITELSPSEELNKILSDVTTENITEALKEIRTERKSEEVQLVLDVPLIDDIEKDDLKKKAQNRNYTDQEKAKVNKYYLIKDTGKKSVDIDFNFAEWYLQDNGRQAIANQKLLSQEIEFLEAGEIWEENFKGTNSPTDYKYQYKKRLLLDDLVKEFKKSHTPLTKEGSDGVVEAFTGTSVEDSGLQDYLNRKAEDIKKYLNLSIGKKSPIKFIRKIYEILGWKLVTYRPNEGNSRVRYYYVNEISKARMESIKEATASKILDDQKDSLTYFTSNLKHSNIPDIKAKEKADRIYDLREIFINKNSSDEEILARKKWQAATAKSEEDTLGEDLGFVPSEKLLPEPLEAIAGF